MWNKLKLKKCYIYIVVVTFMSCIFVIQVGFRSNFDSTELYRLNDGFRISNLRKVTSDRNDETDKVLYSEVDEFGENAEKISRLIKMQFGPVYVMGAALGNTSEESEWDVVKIYASLNRTMYANANIMCCLKYQNDEIVEEIPIHSETERNEYLTVFTAQHFTCKNSRHKDGIIPSGAAIVTDGIPCNDDHVTFIKPFLPLAESRPTLAICTKIAFGNINAEQIIEWMETYIYLGVDKVVTYYLRKINENALKVLRYYASTGILDLYLFEPAGEAVIDREAILRRHSRQFWNDQQMTIFDSFEKMSGYTYFGIIDHDEFLIPSGNRTLKQMLADLFKQHRNIAGYVFLSQYFYTSWGRSGDYNDMILGTYVNRTKTEPVIDNQKCLYMPKYTSYGSAKTHTFKPTEGLLSSTVSASDGFIRHYRQCRWQYVSKSYREDCLYTMERVTDLSMAEWSMRIMDNVREVRRKIFGGVNPVS